MNIANLILIVYVVILLVTIIMGIVKGWFDALCRCIILTIAGVVAYFCMGPVGGWVGGLPCLIQANTSIHDFVYNFALQFVDNNLSALSSPLPASFATEGNLQSIMTEAGFPSFLWGTVWSLIQNNMTPTVITTVVDGVEYTGEVIYLNSVLATTAASLVSQLLAYLFIFIICWIIGLIILAIVNRFIDRWYDKREEKGKKAKPVISRIIGGVLGAGIGVVLIFGLNTSVRTYSSIEALTSIYDLETTLGVSESSDPSLTKTIYEYSGTVSDWIYGSVTGVQTSGSEEDSGYLIEVEGGEPLIISSELYSGYQFSADDVPAELSDVIEVSDDGSIIVHFPETADELEQIAKDAGVDSLDSYIELLAQYGFTVSEDENGNLTYSMEADTLQELLSQISAIFGASTTVA